MDHDNRPSISASRIERAEKFVGFIFYFGKRSSNQEALRDWTARLERGRVGRREGGRI